MNENKVWDKQKGNQLPFFRVKVHKKYAFPFELDNVHGCVKTLQMYVTQKYDYSLEYTTKVDFEKNQYNKFRQRVTKEKKKSDHSQKYM